MTALSIRNLQKTYGNGVVALKGIDLDVEQGDFFALLGPNGAGKSTAIGIICSLVNKSRGSVQVFGHDLDRDPAAVKRCIGLVPQEFNFNQFEPLEEIVANQAGYYGVDRKEAFRRTEICLRQLDLWGKRHEMARELSGGMKRRLMIARALVHQPKLLILDEPTAGVDVEIRHAMWDLLREINQQGTTIILTTHYLEEAERMCRHIGIINHGEIIEHGSLSQFLNKVSFESYELMLRQPLVDFPDQTIDGFMLSRLDDLTLEVEVTKGQEVNSLFSLLSERRIEVIGIRSAQNRLEQQFMDIVNRSRREPIE
jgi:ABC-2 type transport system ATP-binding protein